MFNLIKEKLYNFIVGVGSPIRLRCYYRPRWRKMNQNNFTELKNGLSLDTMKKIHIGNYTYGLLDVRLGWGFEDLHIKIGSYCSIAAEVEFICGMDHCMSHLLNYPVGSKFFSFSKNKENRNNEKLGKNSAEIRRLENNNKGPIIVDDDVWIGTGAKIMSGVHIGQGAVVAAGAVVTKDIPPYAIAGGVPARVIKYRFSEDKIKKLLQINYSNIPIEKFREIYSEIIKDNFDIDYILNQLNIWE